LDDVNNVRSRGLYDVVNEVVEFPQREIEVIGDINLNMVD